MAEARLPDSSDEAIRHELRNLGYNDVDQELFQLVKHELMKVLQQQEERENASTPQSLTSSFVSSSSSTNSALSITLDPEAEERHRSRFQKSSRGRSSKSVCNNSPPCSSNANNNSSRHSVHSDSSTSENSMLRRKAFRYVNGKRIVTEELRPIPQCPGKENNVSTIPLQRNQSCPNVDSSSTSDLCIQMSCVSVNSRSSGSSERSRSESRCSGVLLPNLNVKRKKCDPVSRYHEYRKYWDTFKLPGENNHKQLRWTVRERMLDYDFS